jgi:GTP pyrophosphokinase
MNDLEAAIEMALDAHRGDTDKAGKTYIRHPLRLMERVDTDEERIVAVLHDVVEDSGYQLEEIEEKFGRRISDAVDVLTKPDNSNVDYLDEYIPAVVENSIARKVKRADLKDNLDVTRLPELNDNDCQNIQKYHQALQQITAVDDEQS